MDRKTYDEGLKVEMEHRNTYIWLRNYIKENKAMPSQEEFYLHIVRDHLLENPDYYKILKKTGL